MFIIHFFSLYTFLLVDFFSFRTKSLPLPVAQPKQQQSSVRFSFSIPKPTFFFSPFLPAEKEFYMWGVDVCSQTRVGTPQEFLHWNKIGEAKTLQQIHFGPQHITVLVEGEETEETEVWTWGASNRGMLGISADSDGANPTNLTPRGRKGEDKVKRQPVLVASLFKEQVGFFLFFSFLFFSFLFFSFLFFSFLFFSFFLFFFFWNELKVSLP